jgi:hypothetical protein
MWFMGSNSNTSTNRGHHISFMLREDGKVVIIFKGQDLGVVSRKNIERLREWVDQLPPIWKPQDISVYQAWLTAIETEASDKLTSWEGDFLDSISNRLANNRNLTENQANTLERIYTEKTS